MLSHSGISIYKHTQYRILTIIMPFINIIATYVHSYILVDVTNVIIMNAESQQALDAIIASNI